MHTGLRALREARAFTMAEVAEATGIVMGTVYLLESGKTKRPRPGTIRKLAEFYGVTPDAIRAALAPVDAA